MKVGGTIETLSIGNGLHAKQGKYLAYRPKYKGYHASGIGTIFVNLEKLFPCSKSVQMVCSRMTYDEDGLLKGKAILDASDGGNNMKIFGNGINTYALAIQGCSYLTGSNGCLHKYNDFAISCLLPQSCL